MYFSHHFAEKSLGGTVALQRVWLQACCAISSAIW